MSHLDVKQHAPTVDVVEQTTTLHATFFFAGSTFSRPPGPLNARHEDSASVARRVTGVAEVTDVPGFETSGRRAPCNGLLTGRVVVVKIRAIASI